MVIFAIAQLSCYIVELPEAYGSVGELLLLTTDTATVAWCGFYYAGPATWNSLPPHMADMSMSLFSLRILLKTLLFHWHIHVMREHFFSVATSIWHICDVFLQIICAFNIFCLIIIIITYIDVWDCDSCFYIFRSSWQAV